MVVAAESAPGVIGARMTGAGFGGCAVALVESEKTNEFANSVRESYSRITGFEAAIHECNAVQGASVNRA